MATAAAFQPVRAVEVRIWNQRVGAVALDPKLGYYAFEYSPDFVATGVELAPLQMPLALAAEPFVFLDLAETTYRRLPAMLADALPDDFGNALIDAWMAQRGVSRDAITPLDRLAYMASRGFGALEFKPMRGPPRSTSSAIELVQLVEGARRALSGDLSADPEAAAAIRQVIHVGTSAGGARAKASVAFDPQSGEIRAGQFDAPPGFEHWLIKFDGVGRDSELGSPQGYGRIEYAYYLMARAAGIEMNECRLLEENGRAHFMTKRFDREDNRKLHLQSLCALAHLDFRQKATHDYSQYLQTILALGLGMEALEQALLRIAFNVAARNCDDHTKNLAFLLPEGGRWRLAPAFDVTFAYNPRGEWTYQHLMSVGGKFSGIARDDLLALADRYGIGRAPKLIDAATAAVRAWPEFAHRAGVSAPDIDRISRAHELL